jgi:hypothetical protein
LVLSLILVAIQATGAYFELIKRWVQPILLGALLVSLVGFGFGAYGLAVAKRRWKIRNLVLVVVALLNGVLFTMILPSAMQ